MKAGSKTTSKLLPFLLVITLQCAVSSSFAAMNPRNDKHSNCENLEIPLCKQFYKRVSFPNQVNEKSQWEAAISLYRMLPITRVGCSRSKDFKRLLCMTYMPPCTSPLLPSWVTLCKKVKSDCGPFLAKFGVTWPWQLQCEKFQVETFQKANLKMISVNTSATTKTSLKTRPEHKCEPLRIQTCKRFYNHTRMPNFLNQKSQRSVKTSLQRSRRYLKKEKSTCREPLRLFLCSLYVPKCSGSPVPELPCRSLCRKVKKHCGQTVGLANIIPDCSVFPRRKNQDCLQMST